MKYLVVGLGQTGLSAVKYLLAEGHQVAVADSRLNPPGLADLEKIAPAIVVECGSFSSVLLAWADVIFMSPGVGLQEKAIHEAVLKGKPFVGDIELFAKVVRAPVIGITGSNGKSTVTTLVGEMAKKAGLRVVVAGNIGLPVLDVCHKEADLFVLELSSFQLETTHTLSLLAAAILNISENHLDRYENIQAYVQAKQRIYHHAKTAICFRQDKQTFPEHPVENLITTGVDLPDCLEDYGILSEQGTRYLVQGSRQLIAESALFLQGRHNLLNAQSALALARAALVPMESCLAALAEFKGLEHRCEWVAESGGVRWYNDSKATTIAATTAALETLSNGLSKQIILIAGGVGKEADFTHLRPTVLQHVKQLILIGVDARVIQAACDGAAPIVMASSLDDAIIAAQGVALPGDIVLLAPACASYDMFDHFEHRGRVFKEKVKELLYAKS